MCSTEDTNVNADGEMQDGQACRMTPKEEGSYGRSVVIPVRRNEIRLCHSVFVGERRSADPVRGNIGLCGSPFSHIILGPVNP